MSLPTVKEEPDPKKRHKAIRKILPKEMEGPLNEKDEPVKALRVLVARKLPPEKLYLPSPQQEPSESIREYIKKRMKEELLLTEEEISCMVSPEILEALPAGPAYRNGKLVPKVIIPIKKAFQIVRCPCCDQLMKADPGLDRTIQCRCGKAFRPDGKPPVFPPTFLPGGRERIAAHFARKQQEQEEAEAQAQPVQPHWSMTSPLPPVFGQPGTPPIFRKSDGNFFGLSDDYITGLVRAFALIWLFKRE